MLFVRRLAFISVVILLGAAFSASAENRKSSKVDRALREALAKSNGPQRVIIRTRPGYRGGVKRALQDHGDRVDSDLPSIEGLTADVHGEDIAILEEDPGVVSISADALVHPYRWMHEGAPVVNIPAARYSPLSGSRREREGIEAARISTNVRTTLGVDDSRGGGRGSGVAVIDSGVRETLDLEGRLSEAFYDFSRGTIKRTQPYDDYGHGTHVASLIASRFVGVAPNATIVGLKVLDANGQGRTSDVIRAIEFAIGNRWWLGIDTINLSLGHPILESAATDPLVQAVEHAVRKGLVVVVSAGNFGINPKTGEPGYAGITSPGNAPSAITVGAARTFDTPARGDDRVAPYSSRGPAWYDGFAKPDVLAPGDSLLSTGSPRSTLDRKFKANGGAGNYLRLSGTSMAAAVASGVAALVRGANPRLTPNAVKAVLEFTAIPVETSPGVTADALSQGAGATNADGAVRLATAIRTWAPLGEYWLTTAVPPTSTIAGEPLAWSQNIVWGNSVLAGPDLLAVNRGAWSQNIVWSNGDYGDNIVWGNTDSIVWGNNIVWGNAIVWGNDIVWGNNIIGTLVDGNVLWGSLSGDGDNIVWGNLDDGDNIVWGNTGGDGDNIVWGNGKGDAIVWGNDSSMR